MVHLLTKLSKFYCIWLYELRSNSFTKMFLSWFGRLDFHTYVNIHYNDSHQITVDGRRKCVGQRKSIRIVKKKGNMDLMWIFCVGIVYVTQLEHSYFNKYSQKGKNGAIDFRTIHTYKMCYIFITSHSSSKWNKWKSTSGSPRPSKRKIQKKNDACSKSKRTTGVFKQLSLVVRWLEHWNAEAKNNDTIYVRVDTNEEDKLNMRTVGGILRIG